MELNQPLAEYNGKPEVDDGHTKIANELLDAVIGHEFSKRQLKIILFIMMIKNVCNFNQEFFVHGFSNTIRLISKFALSGFLF